MIETSETASNSSGVQRSTKRHNNKKEKEKVDINVLHLKNISEIITVLIESYEKRNKVNLHQLISETTRKNKVPRAPKLV